jgi:hypothetical protein
MPSSAKRLSAVLRSHLVHFDGERFAREWWRCTATLYGSPGADARVRAVLVRALASFTEAEQRQLLVGMLKAAPEVEAERARRRRNAR